jgi:hypothetical protein
MSHGNNLIGTSLLRGANYVFFGREMTSDIDFLKANNRSQLQTSRLRHHLRQKREARVEFYRASIVSAFFVFLLAASILGGTALAVNAYHSQPAENTHIARVILPMHDGVSCRQLLFDDKTLASKQDQVVRCDDLAPASSRGRPKPKFTWR